jgi:hypothetical protein
MMLVCVVVIAFSLPKQPRFKYEFHKGKTWMNKDLYSPLTFAILKSADQLENDKKLILESILPIYQFHPEISKAQIVAFSNEFDIKWKSNQLNDNEKAYFLEKSLKNLQAIFAKGIIDLDTKHIKEDRYFEFSFVQNHVSTPKTLKDVFSINQAVQQFEREIYTSNPAIKAMLVAMAESYLKPNLIYDAELTTTVQHNAIGSMSNTRGMVQKGDLIVAKGNVVDDDIYQKLASFKNIYDTQTTIAENEDIVLMGQLLLVAFIITLLMVFLFLFRKDIFADNRQLSLLLLVVTSMMLVLNWALQSDLPNLYIIPFCIVPIIIRILFDTRLAMNLHLLVILIAAFFVPNSFEFVFYQVTAGMVAIFSVRTLVKREQLLISAAFILISYFISFIGITFVREASFERIEWINFLPFLFSVLLSLLAYPLIYAFEKLFGITSDVALIELTNTNSKLLRELAFKAPGTFQHSLQVANLAEAAIFKIGGNALLVRAGALYHDIGKIENPQYFIENQTGQSPHDKLPYDQSAQIIIRHVYKGIEMARKRQLPESVIDFIRTHHGNTRVDYFYQSFLKNSPEKFIDENIFRYPGPIPFSKETGVLMLADSVEAASRSLQNPDAKSINDLVERIIDYKLKQNQLDNCDLTLKDFETIKLIFKTMLMSIHHVRVDYQQTM